MSLFKTFKLAAINFIAASFCLSVATAQVPQPNTPYLALGDSLAFGYNPQVKTWNLSQYVGYPLILSNSLHLNLTNGSCPGETSGSLVTGAPNSYLPGFNCQDFSNAGQLFVSYGGASQLNYAIAYLHAHPNTSLVTINVGGNDLGVLQYDCKGDPTCEGNNLPGVLSAVGQNLDTIFAGLRGIGYNGPIVALNYYAFNYKDPFQVGVFTALNNVIASSAKTYSVAVADGYKAFQIATTFTNGDACAAGLLLKNPDGTCDTHPTFAGHAVLAAAVAHALPQ